MAMAAGAALFRSVATKMARAPPRLQSALEHHGRRLPTSSGGLRRSSFSTSSGTSTPSSANLEGPQDKVGSGWYRVIVAFNEAVSIATFFMIGGVAFMHFHVNPALDRMEASMDAQRQTLVNTREGIKKSHERTPAILLSNKESQIVATDVSEG